MSDTQFIREIDEDLRRDRLLKLWEQYGVYVVIAAFLIVAATGGWRGWEWYQTREGLAAGTRFESALALAESGKSLWVLHSDRQVTPWAGRYIVVIDSERKTRPAWSPVPGSKARARVPLAADTAD